MVPTPNAVPVDPESLLLDRLRQGEDAAFEELVREHSPRMLAVARRFLSSEDDVRDAVQEAFISAFKSIQNFEGNARLSTWLHRIVVNAALMKLRRKRRKPEESIEDLLPQFTEDGHRVNPAFEWDGRQDADLERSEDRDFVRQAIESLPDTYRNVLLLRDIEELNTEETAGILGVSENAVKIRLHRARQALRTLLLPRFGVPERVPDSVGDTPTDERSR